MSMIIALAGRRVDAIDAERIRFSPEPESIGRVRERLHTMLVSQGSVALVSSAACGADLLALEEGGRLGLRRRVILPFSPAKFRSISVIDRPGNWGPLYDTVIAEVDLRRDLLVLACDSDDAAFIETNHTIIENAIALGESLKCHVSAVRVWEGAVRGTGDLTEEFGIYAQKRGVPLIDDVLTI